MSKKIYQITREEEEANDLAYDTFISWEFEKHYDRLEQAIILRKEAKRLGRSLTAEERKALIWEEVEPPEILTRIKEISTPSKTPVRKKIRK